MTKEKCKKNVQIKISVFHLKLPQGCHQEEGHIHAHRKFWNFKEDVAFHLSVTQTIPTSNEQMMKTKLRTFAHKQILHGKHNVQPVGLYENTS